MTFVDSLGSVDTGAWESAAAAGRRRRVLLLASEADIQYRVLRCAASLDADVHVMGPSRAHPLAFSRFCKKFHAASDFAKAPEASLARKIDAIAREHGIDLVIPGDTVTTRLLTRIRDALATPVFPVPEAETFDALVTKDRFMEVCARFGVPHPKGALYLDRAGLLAAIGDGRVRFPAMFKPLNRAGGIGIVKADADNAHALAAAIDYAPILVQDFVDGEDRSISIFCRGGEIKKEVVYSHPDGVFHFHDEPELSRLVRELAGAMKLDGVINFDARVDPNGKVWLIECNPRFFFSMDAIMIAGINFADVEAGTRAAFDPRRDVKLPRTMMRDVLKLRLPAGQDWKMLAHWLGDPLMLAYAASGYKRL
jgi:predicted ATP-grasp superfamily ATP-dependent carboligase